MLHDILLQTSSLKQCSFVNITQNISSSVGQYAGGLGWVLRLGFYKAEIKMSAKLHSQGSKEELTSELTQVVDRIVSCGFRTEVPVIFN